MTTISRTGPVALTVRAAALAVALAALSGCGGGNMPLASAITANHALEAGYRVAAGDKLRVTVFDEPTLTGEYEIGDGGALSLPLIDAIPAGGMTTTELSSAISDTLRDGGYVLSPRVSVEILLHRPFFILGEVTKPGEYPYSGELTLEQAVAKAGGYTPRADKRVIKLRRQQWTSAKRIKLDGAALKIAPGDTVTIQEAFF